MSSDSLLEQHIKPYILKQFGDADLVLLAGSQARLLNEQEVSGINNVPTKNSDYDFVIVYKELPKGFDAAFFASAWLNVPGMDEPISVDMKVMDLDYLKFHAEQTREVRRFPFLFRMTSDSYPIIDKHNILPDLKKEAEDFIKAGPAPLGQTQISELNNEMQQIAGALQETGNDPAALNLAALEALHTLSVDYLRSRLEWDGSTPRALERMREINPQEEQFLLNAFNKASAGKVGPYLDFVEQVNAQLKVQAGLNMPDPAILHQNVDAFVNPDEKKESNMNGARIMIAQYLSRLSTPEPLDISRELETKSVLWLSLKKILCDDTGVPFSFGQKAADAADAAFGKPVLKTLFNALQKSDMKEAYQAADAILEKHGGVAFTHLKRVYVEDLARRRSNDAKAAADVKTFKSPFFSYA